MTIRYDISAGYIGKNLNDIDYSSGGGDLSISHITTAIETDDQTTYNFTGIDFSNITDQDALVVLTQSEAQNGGVINSITASGSTMTSVVQSVDSVGTVSPVTGIHTINGSEINKTASETISVALTTGSVRISIMVFRLINGVNARVLDTDFSQTTNQTTLTNTVDFSDPNAVLFSSGYFANDQGHTFTSGIEEQFVGVQEAFGGGDAAINETPTNSSHNIVYTIGGTVSNQGDSLVTAVFAPAVSLSQGLYSMNAVYNSNISEEL